MPDNLRTLEFTENELDVVQDFDCGDEGWERPLADWIKADPKAKNGPLPLIRKQKGKFQVWLYVNGQGDLVGYSSLTVSNWQWPTKDDPRIPFNVIPYVAIQREFWGQPKGDPPKYSKQIFDHLVFQARQHTERHPFLGLFVHPLNERAISAYTGYGFQFGYRTYSEDGVEYKSMFLKLNPEAEPVVVQAPE